MSTIREQCVYSQTLLHLSNRFSLIVLPGKPNTNERIFPTGDKFRTSRNVNNFISILPRLLPGLFVYACRVMMKWTAPGSTGLASSRIKRAPSPPSPTQNNYFLWFRDWRRRRKKQKNALLVPLDQIAFKVLQAIRFFHCYVLRGSVFFQDFTLWNKYSFFWGGGLFNGTISLQEHVMCAIL